MLYRIFLIFLLSVAFFAGHGQAKIHFRHLTTAQGLSSDHINALIKDEEGFMWFGTNTGLDRFDGNRFKTYAYSPNDNASLLSNTIVDFFMGFDNRLWIRTIKGDCVYDVQRDNFVRNTDSLLREQGFVNGAIKEIIHTTAFSYVLYNNGDLYHRQKGKEKATKWANRLRGKIVDMALDSAKNNLLLISDKGEIVALGNERLQLQDKLVFGFDKVVDNSEFKLFIDNKGAVWVYAKNFPFGAMCYKNLKTSPIIFKQDSEYHAVNNNYISNIQQLGDAIWLATDHGGINVFDLSTDRISFLVHDHFDRTSLPYNSTTAMYKDADNILWVGMYKGGVSYYHPNLNHFSLYQHQIGNDRSLPFNDINCFAEDKEGMIWIGTNGGGLVKFDPKNNSFTSFKHDTTDEGSLGSNVVVSLEIDKEDNLWVGTYHGGLNKYEHGKFKRYLHHDKNGQSINDNSVWSMLNDSKGRFWVGMLSGGIDLMGLDHNQFSRFAFPSSSSFYSSYNSKILEDSAGNIWFGTSSGVAKLSALNVVSVYNESADRALLNNVVTDILEDRFGKIWVATQSGLNIMFDDNMTHLTTDHGLIDNVIVGLVLDRYGDVWATTLKGISRIHYNPQSDVYVVQNFDKSDGLQSANFNERAVFRLKDGNLLFGGSEGFNVFLPKPAVKIIPSPLHVVDFKILGADISFDRYKNIVNTWMNKIATGKQVSIPHYIHSFTIQLTDFNFIKNHKSKIQYQLSGGSNDWVDLDDFEISLTNLAHGSYILYVRVLESSGRYSDPQLLLNLHMNAPWWRTGWAYFAYLLILLLILLFFRRIEKMRTQTKFNLIQAEEKSRHMKEMDDLRTTFFTNVSHEFRTPISLILSPLEQLKTREGDQEKHRYIEMIERNALSLLNLVNQLLDFNKIELRKHSLKLVYGEPFPLLKDIANHFTNAAQSQQIDYRIAVEQDSFKAYFDSNKLERIILNLLSNAFKFTPVGGSVVFRAYYFQEEAILCVEVEDTGIGIPAQYRDKIFDRYFQVENGGVVEQRGSGLGLAIVKEYVDLMEGTTEVVSEEGDGTLFTLRIPLEKVIEKTGSGMEVKQGKIRKENGTGITSGKVQKILLVEDNKDFAFYLKNSLEDMFHVEVFDTVDDAWHAVPHFHPDIIISDLSLPGKSGIDFCHLVRSHERTEHIPFIVITALGADDKQLEALQYGATDFITKPFNFEIFLSKVKTLLEQKDSMAKRYKRQVDVKVTQAEVVNEDEKFILKLTATIEQHLQNESFSVELLASSMCITRVGLYKKILALTGYTPIEFIRNIRLNKALDLLKNSTMTISEISYEVGFGSPKQFSKYFKTFYGELPSAFRK